MNGKLRIAVTGVAGASGQSVLKALRMIDDFEVEIHALDVTPYSAGLYMSMVDHMDVLSKPEEDIEPWIDYVQRNKITAIIPGADRDLIPLAEHADETRVLANSLRFLRMSRDKWLTAQTLSSHGFQVPKTELLAPGQFPSTIGYPCVIKPRNEAASRGFHICDDDDEFSFYLALTRSPMVQEYLEGDEYSVNVFSDALCSPVAALVMKRVMRDGVAYKSVPVDSEELRQFGMSVALALKSRGTINIQFRKTEHGAPLVFEINARCSGSTAIRAWLGYNDPEMLIRHFIYGQKIVQPRVDYYKFVFRYYEELYVERFRLPESEEEAFS